ncbi:hypothetical protein NDN11_18110 [Acinetobacter sp. C26M]|uniref:hypothetical protein n=1 Tax=unclassified Acinetobacter TaxID=196816 RepID=UPI002036C6FD|nr:MULTISPECIES: hypothetical protein [unclassified Acinetobacter]USA46560.1 hypothetical protein NDN11_18110 [Acinetobacter sp. C26M]USA50044.1 hypothetical protein NDN12_18025 [Acinetobacter sp. C26G]
MKQQFATAWILFEYTDAEGKLRQSFALIECIVDDINAAKNETFLSYHSKDVLSEELVAFDEDEHQILCYKILAKEQFDVDELAFFQWENDVQLDGKLLYFYLPKENSTDKKGRVFLGWADFEHRPAHLEVYTSYCTQLVDINEYQGDIYWGDVPFLDV